MNRKIFDAEYEKLESPDFAGNPLIEAIGIGYSFELFNMALVGTKPISRKVALKLSKNERESLLIGLRQRFFVPNENHYSLYKIIKNSMLAGYSKRNPFIKNPIKEIKRSYKDLLNFTEDLDLTTNSLGSLFIGPSGIGKSTLLNKIMSLYPFGIRHDLEGLDPFIQIPFIKLECPKDSSIKELCVDFLELLDKNLQTKYKNQYFKGNRTSVYELVNAMGKLTVSHQIGVIFIDEIQKLIKSPRANKNDLLMFFTKLNNTLNIPIIIIGTPDITALIETDYSLMRRWSGEGATRWNRLAQNEDWDIFIQSLFKYQYTDGFVECDQQMSDYFYEVSQGLIDVAIRLFIGAQRQAFESDNPDISFRILNKVKKSKFWLEDKAIEEIRKPKRFQNSNYSELMKTQNDTHMPESNSDRVIQIQKELRQLYEKQNYQAEEISAVLEAYPNKNNAEIVLQILKSYNESTDVQENSKTQELAVTKEKKKTNKPSYDESDLRLCYDSDELKLKHKLEEIGIIFDLKNSNLLMK